MSVKKQRVGDHEITVVSKKTKQAAAAPATTAGTAAATPTSGTGRSPRAPRAIPAKTKMPFRGFQPLPSAKTPPAKLPAKLPAVPKPVEPPKPKSGQPGDKS